MRTLAHAGNLGLSTEPQQTNMRHNFVMYKPETLNVARKWQHENYVGNKAKVEKQHIDITGGRESPYFSV